MRNDLAAINPIRRIYAVDIGSTLKRQAFAWAATVPGPSEVIGSTSIQTLVDAISADLQRGLSVALGLEAPLFIPVPEEHGNLSRGRNGERDRSCMAPAGGYVTTLALHQAAWILREIRKTCGSLCRFSLDGLGWPPGEGGPVLFVWEAFVSNAAHAVAGQEDPHLRDAATAARFFADHEDEIVTRTQVKAEHPLSLIGAAALWSGWSADLDLLKTPTVVLRPAVPYEGVIRKIWV